LKKKDLKPLYAIVVKENAETPNQLVIAVSNVILTDALSALRITH